MSRHTDPLRSALAELIEFITFLLFLVGFPVVVMLLSAEAEGATPAPMQWFDGATYYGGAGNKITLLWRDKNEPPAARYEVRAFWLERPSKSPILWKLRVADVLRVKDMPSSTDYTVSKLMQMPGAGTFSFEFRSCFGGTPEVCTEWSQSIDPAAGLVKGMPKGWRAYFYTEPPSVVVPIPSATPTGPEK